MDLWFVVYQNFIFWINKSFSLRNNCHTTFAVFNSTRTNRIRVSFGLSPNPHTNPHPHPQPQPQPQPRPQPQPQPNPNQNPNPNPKPNPSSNPNLNPNSKTQDNPDILVSMLDAWNFSSPSWSPPSQVHFLGTTITYPLIYSKIDRPAYCLREKQLLVY